MNEVKCNNAGAMDARPETRRETRKQDRRDAIVAVASRYFLDHGYSATSMSAIAATLGGSKGTLWNYFPSKEELFTAVIDHASTAFRAELSQILDPCGSLSPTLRNFALRLVEKVTSPNAIALNRLVLAEAARFPEIGEIFYERAPRRTVALLAEFLSGAMNRGQLRTDDPVSAAQMFMTLCVSRLQQLLMLGLIPEASLEEKEQEAERALGIFLRAYALDTKDISSLP